MSLQGIGQLLRHVKQHALASWFAGGFLRSSSWNRSVDTSALADGGYQAATVSFPNASSFLRRACGGSTSVKKRLKRSVSQAMTWA